ncbi:hypothetical protein N7528_009800 [Penicillium herquei]|nr:hypothetical protein N7528_009800 [Penicillium herquei]
MTRFLGISKNKKLQNVELEKELEQKANIYELQQHREKEAQGCDKAKEKSSEHQPIDRFLRLERRLREIAQRVILLEEKLNQNNSDSESALSPEEVEKIQKELQEFRAEFFMTEQERKSLCTKLHVWTKRALDLWRSQPQWYLHKVLVQDCEDRGGCCGRSCGCCQKRKHLLKTSRQSAVGHCTAECGCCQEARGFAFTDEQKKKMRDFYPLNPECNAIYFRKIMLASVYGLVDDCDLSPFDHIDKPPKYE